MANADGEFSDEKKSLSLPKMKTTFNLDKECIDELMSSCGTTD